MNSYYLNDFLEFEKEMNEAAMKKDHDERRPRATKYGTTAFYNFRNKKRRKK